jgi:hypothetical protein
VGEWVAGRRALLPVGTCYRRHVLCTGWMCAALYAVWNSTDSQGVAPNPQTVDAKLLPRSHLKQLNTLSLLPTQLTANVPSLAAAPKVSLKSIVPLETSHLSLTWKRGINPGAGAVAMVASSTENGLQKHQHGHIRTSTRGRA